MRSAEPKPLKRRRSGLHAVLKASHRTPPRWAGSLPPDLPVNFIPGELHATVACIALALIIFTLGGDQQRQQRIDSPGLPLALPSLSSAQPVEPVAAAGRSPKRRDGAADAGISNLACPDW